MGQHYFRARLFGGTVALLMAVAGFLTAVGAAGAPDPYPPYPPYPTTTTTTTTPSTTTTTITIVQATTPTPPAGSGGPSKARSRAALAGVLKPKGKLAKIAALLRRGGFRFTFSAPSAGTLTLRWYYLPAGAHVGRASRRGKPTLIASRTASIARAGRIHVQIKLTAAGRAILKRSQRLNITARDTFSPSKGPAVTERATFTLIR
jgi:hypothetical protein